jgi:hypothetical protein
MVLIELLGRYQDQHTDMLNGLNGRLWIDAHGGKQKQTNKAARLPCEEMPNHGSPVSNNAAASSSRRHFTDPRHRFAR